MVFDHTGHIFSHTNHRPSDPWSAATTRKSWKEPRTSHKRAFHMAFHMPFHMAFRMAFRKAFQILRLIAFLSSAEDKTQPTNRKLEFAAAGGDSFQRGPTGY